MRSRDVLMCSDRYAADIPLRLPKTQLPPTRSDFSKTSISMPASRSFFAAAIPDDPAPITQALGSFDWDIAPPADDKSDSGVSFAIPDSAVNFAGRTAADHSPVEFRVVLEPTHTAVGTWSGGRFMHFGEALDDERMARLLRPDERIRTVLTADVYGEGEADRLLGRALAGVERDSYCLVGAIGHDFYDGEREGAKGFPRFTDPRLRGEDGYASYLRMAAERSLERLGADRFDLLMLHNPDRTGYTSEVVWSGLEALREAGLTRLLGVAPGPAN